MVSFRFTWFSMNLHHSLPDTYLTGEGRWSNLRCDTYGGCVFKWPTMAIWCPELKLSQLVVCFMMFHEKSENELDSWGYHHFRKNWFLNKQRFFFKNLHQRPSRVFCGGFQDHRKNFWHNRSFTFSARPIATACIGKAAWKGFEWICTLMTDNVQ